MNVLHNATDNILVGAELLRGEREDFDGDSGDDVRVEFTFKYNFSTTL